MKTNTFNLLGALLLTFFGLNLSATHNVGGEITYRYVGDSTGTPHQYEVNIVLYGSTRFTPLQLPNQQNFCITSSCFPNQTHTAFPAPGFSTAQPLNIPSTPTINNNQESKKVYRTIVTLPGVCSDFRFQATTACCRLPGATNISSFGSSGSMFLFAYLNNTLGNNNSPVFTADPQINFCASNTVHMIQNVTESNGDSLTISFSNARTANNACANIASVASSTYATGFNSQKPFDTQGNANISINQTNGNATFSSGALLGMYIFSMAVTEHRLNPIDSSYNIVGRVNREVLVYFIDCPPPPSPNPPFLRVGTQNNPSIHANKDVSTDHRAFMMGFTPKDSSSLASSPTGFVYSLPNKDFECPDTVIHLQLEYPMVNQTIDPSYFYVVGPDTQAIPVVNIDFNHNAFSDEIYIELAQPLYLNGQHFIMALPDPAHPMAFMYGIEFSDTMVFSLSATNCPENLSNTAFETTILQPRISPNPSTDFINMKNPNSSRLSYEILDLRGSRYQVGEINAHSETTCQTAHLSSGVYLIIFTDEYGRRITQKMIKQ
jgi:hypothetical protein